MLLLQAARAWVIAEMQAVTYGEYAAAILGSPLAPYTGYNASIDPSVSGRQAAGRCGAAAGRGSHAGAPSPRRMHAGEFAAAAFRFAHSGANTVYGCVEADGSECAQVRSRMGGGVRALVEPR